MLEGNQPYICKITGATFTKKCTVASCFANIRNLNSSDVDVRSTTNCAYADFQRAGFAENLDYAVEEQGFVGYRDLQYISTFLNVPPIKLRDIYTDNVNTFRKTIAVIWAVKSEVTDCYCSRCGHPLKQTFKCVSTSICEERRDAAMTIIQDVLVIVPEDQHAKALNVVWKSLNTKYTPRIMLTDTEIETLQDL